MSVEHQVIDVDGLVVECWHFDGFTTSASIIGAFLSFSDEGPVEAIPHNSCANNCEAHLSCLALRAHRRLKEQR